MTDRTDLELQAPDAGPTCPRCGGPAKRGSTCPSCWIELCRQTIDNHPAPNTTQETL